MSPWHAEQCSINGDFLSTTNTPVPIPLSPDVQAFYMKIYKSIGTMAGPFTKQGIVVSFDWGLEELRHMIVKLRYAYSSNNVALLDELLGLP